MEDTIEATIKYTTKGKKCVTNLDEWLKGENIEFNEVDYVNFKESMLSVVMFDKDHCIYVVMPKDCFKVV